MAIPRQVQEAADLAEQIITRNAEGGESDGDGGEGQGEGDGDGEGDGEGTADAGDGDPSASADADGDGAGEGNDSDTPTRTDDSEVDWKARYDTLQGKYDAEVPRLNNELKSFKEKIFDRLDEIQKPAAKDDEGAGENADTPDEYKDAVEEFRSEFGDDMANRIEKIFSAKEKQLQSQLTPVSEKVDVVEESQLKVAREAFEGHVNDNVKGDWKKGWNGEDPAFNEFLQQPDPSGLYTNGELLALYSQNWDQVKFAKLLAMHYGTPEAPKVDDPPAKKDDPPVVPAKKDDGKQDLVAPARQTSTEVPDTDGDGDGIVWTQETFRQFEKDDRMGKYSEEESQRLWNSLLTALKNDQIK